MEGLSPRLRDALTELRERINTVFSMARHHNPSLSEELFGQRLLCYGNSLSAVMEGAPSDAFREAVSALADVLLDLIGKGVIGEGGRYPGFEEDFARIAFRFSVALAESPRKLLASLANARLKLESYSAARSSEWMMRMETLDARLPASAVLAAGVVSAWVCGLSALRDAALTQLASLPETTAYPLFRLEGFDGGMAALIGRLKEDLWFDPAYPAAEGPVFKDAGGFLGFDGPFLRPPEVYADDGVFLLFDGETFFRLFADAFGAMLVRTAAPDNPVSMNRKALSEQGWEWNGEGGAVYRGVTIPLPENFPGSYRSTAAIGPALCYTSAESHRAFLLGLPGGRK